MEAHISVLHIFLSRTFYLCRKVMPHSLIKIKIWWYHIRTPYLKFNITWQSSFHWFILVWLNMQIVTMYDLRSYFIQIQTPSEEVFNCLLHAVKILFYTWYHQNIDKCKNKYNKTPRYVLWYVFQDIVFEKQ